MKKLEGFLIGREIWYVILATATSIMMTYVAATAAHTYRFSLSSLFVTVQTD